MKKSLFIIQALLVTLVVLSQWSCKKGSSFLDQKVSASLNEKTVFADSARTMDYLADIYEGLYYWYNTATPNGANGPWSEVSDESETKWPGGQNIPNQVFEGTFGDPFYNNMKSSWTHLYSRIRQCNIFLRDVKESPLSPALQDRTKAEARFLRAYHYFLLMEAWGGVPLVGDTVYSLSAASVNVRASWDDCVN